jgi:hypothetical protein
MCDLAGWTRSSPRSVRGTPRPRPTALVEGGPPPARLCWRSDGRTGCRRARNGCPDARMPGCPDARMPGCPDGARRGGVCRARAGRRGSTDEERAQALEPVTRTVHFADCTPITITLGYGWAARRRCRARAPSSQYSSPRVRAALLHSRMIKSISLPIAGEHLSAHARSRATAAAYPRSAARQPSPRPGQGPGRRVCW